MSNLNRAKGGRDLPGERVVAIVQARFGSTRLPGKMLLDLCGHPILHWVLARACRSREVNLVVLATSTSRDDDPLTTLANDLGIACFRGDEHDVLGRLTQAAETHKADTIVRICADNPLIAPEEIDRLVRFYRNAIGAGESEDRLYAFNAIPFEGNDYPDGLGAEIFSMSILSHIDETAQSQTDREHVTPALRDNPKEYDALTFNAPRDIAGANIKLDIDTEDDLERMRTLCQCLNLKSSAAEIVEAYRTMFAEKGQ